jgi:hypothetical protein
MNRYGSFSRIYKSREILGFIGVFLFYGSGGLKIEKNKTPPTKEGFPLSTIAYYIYGDGIGDSLETTPAQQGKLSH